MKSSWDELGDDFANNPDVVIGDVDCTVKKHEKLCAKIGVEGYPTLKYFTTATSKKGESYEGEREYEALKKFADENLGPSCDNEHEDLCTEEQLATLAKYNAMTAQERKAIIKGVEAEIKAIEKGFEKAVEELQAAGEKIDKDKEEKLKTINTRELSLIKGIDAPKPPPPPVRKRKRRGKN